MKDKTSLKLPIILMVAPLAGIIAAFILYAIVNAVAASSTTSVDSELFTQTPAWATAFNSILFIIGGICVMAFMPCLIIGLVVLVQRLDRRKNATHTPQPPRQWGDVE